MSDPHEGHHHSESDTNQDGVVSMEEAVAGGEEHMAAQAADVEAAAAAEAERVANLPPPAPLDTSDAGLYTRGMAPYQDLTSPGGPWHGLPPEAATDPNNPQWEENQRWACVQGSFFACTVDGTGMIGEQASNVRGYGIPSEEGAAYMRSISHLPEDQRVMRCIAIGNGIAYNGQNVNLTTPSG
jgi:hypothetical protein